MAHVRQQITDQVLAALAGLATTGARVYAGRSVPLGDEHMPGLCVYGRTDVPDYENGAMGCTPRRVLTIVVEGYAKPATDAVLNQIAAEVETALFASGSGITIPEAYSLGDQELDIDGTTEKDAGIISMAFVFWYRTTEGQPEVAA